MKLTRRGFCKALGTGAAALAMGMARPDKAKDKPNIVLINVDDLGWTDVACFGSKYYETPNIDRLAAGGMKFTDAYAACAVCSPTRAAIMTGRYPARVGITDWIHFSNDDKYEASRRHPAEYVGDKNKEVLCPPNPFWMDHEEVTIAELLKQAGYITCHIGKWHLGPDEWHPETQGFDLNFGGCDFGQPPSYFDPYSRAGDPKRSEIPTLKPRRQGEYLTDRESDEALKFIRDNAGQSFFLNMWHYAVHTPIQAKENVVAKYEKKEKTNQKDPVYAAMVESVDDAVGAIMNTLDELKLTRKTIVIFTSDNGGLLNKTDNAPLRMGKGYPYEGGIRIPQIVSWPGVVRAATVSDEPVTSVDFLPTLCQATGVKEPTDRPIDGRSLMPLLTETPGFEREAIFWHFPHYRGKIVPYSIIRARKWKLIKNYAGKKYQLFDLENDISETTDLSEAMPARVKELDRKLIAWLKDTGAKMPKPNPEYVKK